MGLGSTSAPIFYKYINKREGFLNMIDQLQHQQRIRSFKGYRGGGSSPPPAQQATNTTTNQQPWAPAQPYIKQGLEDASKVYAQGPQQYTPWSQVANFSPLQQSAMTGIHNYVNSAGTQNFMNTATNAFANNISGDPNQLQQVAGSGMGKLAGTLTNNNLYDPAQATNQLAYGNNMNPYTKTNVDSALRKLSDNFTMNTLPGLRRAAIGNGTYGSSRNEIAEGAAAGALANEMLNTSSQMYGNAYNATQQNALNALGESSNQQLTQAGLTNQLFNTGNTQNLNSQSIGLNNYQNILNMPLSMLQQVGQVGLQKYQQNQNVLNDATNKWNFVQQAPWDSFAQFKNMIDNNTAYGGSGSTNSLSVTPTAPVSTAGNITGGLLTAASLASQFGGK